MSRVDVFVPCYNYGHYLRGCLESVLSQQGVDVKVLIIDDASPDHTPEVGTALAAQDRRVEYRRHAANRGHIATYNEGLEWAGGDYTLLLSADDQLTPGALFRAARLMDGHPEVGFTFGKAIKTSNPEPERFQIPSQYRWTILTGPQFLELCCTGNNIVPTATAIVRTSLQKELGGYRQKLPHTGDMEMWMRFAVHASVGRLEADQAYRRIHGNNMCNNYQDVKDLLQRKAAFDILFEFYGERIEGGRRIRRMADRKLAKGAYWLGCNAFDRGEEDTCQRLLDLALEIDPTLRRWPGRVSLILNDWRFRVPRWFLPLGTAVESLVRASRITRLRSLRKLVDRAISRIPLSGQRPG
jgi:glycosyltransferase involved in cell wall biosynthesis